MTTISSSALSQFRLGYPYSGTLEQPDTVSFFFKSKNGIEIKEENIVNSIHYSSDSLLTNFKLTVWKIRESLKRIGSFEDMPNAFANLGRGVIQLFPVLGGVILKLYDTAKKHLYIDPQIRKALSNEPLHSLGIAFDGKIAKKIPLRSFQNFLESCNIPLNEKDNHLLYLEYTWNCLLRKEIQSPSNKTRLDLSNQFIEQ